MPMLTTHEHRDCIWRLEASSLQPCAARFVRPRSGTGHGPLPLRTRHRSSAECWRLDNEHAAGFWPRVRLDDSGRRLARRARGAGRGGRQGRGRRAGARPSPLPPLALPPFATGPDAGPPEADLLRLPLPRKAMVSFLRFRTGCHALPNVIGTRTGVPRSQWLCPLCQAPYSDERHTLLECTALSPLREKYQQLICPHVSMRQFMWQNDLPQLARFVIECLQFLAAAQSTG